MTIPPGDSNQSFHRLDFHAVARWIVEGPRSILLQPGHSGGLWWDKEYQLTENRQCGASLTSLTVYRPFVCKDGLTWSILRRCEIQRDAYQAIRQNSNTPAVAITYGRIENEHPQFEQEIRDLAETLLSELREPPASGAGKAKREFVWRQVTGWQFGSLQFCESDRFTGALQKWQALERSINDAAGDEVLPIELIERFDAAPLGAPLDLPAADATCFHRHANKSRRSNADNV